MQPAWIRSLVALLWGVLAAPLIAQAAWSVTPTPIRPFPRRDHAATYDVLRGRLVVFSGRFHPVGLLADTWELQGATWRDLTPAVSPPPRQAHSLAYDRGRARVLLFGGSVTLDDTGAVDDTWEWDGASWVRQFPAQAPTARSGHAMTWDWARACIVLFGGRDSASAYRNDTWTWNGTNWTQAATTGPSPRCCFALAHDFNRGRVVLFGGSNQVDLGDMWEFDGVAWQPLQPPGIVPSARRGCRMAFDLMRFAMILNGGNNGAGETWQWSGSAWTPMTPVGAPTAMHSLDFDWQIGRVTRFGGSFLGNAGMDTTATFGVASTAVLAPFGSACAGPGGAPQLAAVGTGLPWIGHWFTLQAAPVSTFALLLFGWSDTGTGSIALPHSLAPYGAPGCSVLVSPDAVFGVVANPAATIAVHVPFSPAIVGMQFFNQAISFDPGANALGLTVSNGTAATIGWR